MSESAIALNRFGIGARPDDPAPTNPKRWLIDQFDRYEPRPAVWAALPPIAQLADDYAQVRMEVRQAPKDDPAKKDARKEMRRDARQNYQDAVNARAASALTAAAPFVERLVWFWANHFAVSADKATVVPFAGNFEAEAIRPHVLGRFEDLLLAAERHAAMMLYLDQAQSIGPDSIMARRAAMNNPGRQRGLNENLAREIMELHTLGVRTGYSQADVTEFARALTGWSVGGLGRGGGRPGGPNQGDPGEYLFRPGLHEPGARTIMGRSYTQVGEAQAEAILHDLAVAPATARHIATKLARHFVADDPPPALVDRLSAAFLQSGGDLPKVYRVLIDAPEAWAAGASKFKTPWEWSISAMRGIGMREIGQMQVAPMLNQLGQPVWRPGSPAGFDDVAASWAAPDALVRRVEVAQRFAQRVGDRLDARKLGATLMPGTIAPATEQAIGRAESPVTGLALLLVSPEFQRR
ncbi:DUF1800 domain-containing protein [Sphingomonas crocodyli]|uniref:DUF1800 domain-containing protein n=1 Tax=Sphingomonas crocodyli TaxID=1979270 RepID=A0A437LWE1_9SPHN|nr:DUF1800 domain-containing protein [Sphingomonas crocodyli]RVT89712.1 DUF1800 domain-containing protein [Sphingomonas crocodyli]